MVRSQLLAAAIAALPVPQAAMATEGTGACSAILPSPAAVPGAMRPVQPLDLARLRDVGPLDPEEQGARLVTFSPDGSHIAFQLRRGDPASNGYCTAMVVIDLRTGGAPRIVDVGDEPIRAAIDVRGKAAFPTGIPLSITARWSSDGRWFAFLKRVGGINQVWRARVDGNGSEALTASEVDVEDFRIGEDGRTIVYAARPALAAARAAIAREALTGFHYDDRYAPMSSSRPFPATPIARALFARDPMTRITREATPAEASLLAGPGRMNEDIWTSSLSLSGRRVWTDGVTVLGEPGPLMAETSQGRLARCEAPACAGAYRPYWTQDGARVRYLRREGWARASTAIYEWVPGEAAPRRLYSTDDILADCAPVGARLLCLREGSLQPRRLEWLDPGNGRRAVLFDPNPEFSGLLLGRVERLHLRNSFNYETVADLVLPVGYRQGDRYPLVVVQYQTRGFLRGGTGDDYPIQAFAGRGYAALSIGRPPSVSGRTADPTAAGRINLAGFADTRSTLSNVETGVRLLIDRGIADPARIGLTGMSNGATTATYALSHSNLFAAVAMSQCCFDTTLPIRVGPAAARHFHDEGYPRLTDDGASFWGEISLSRNARRVRTPVLLQVADDELMSALESYTALREVGAPIDMFVFPDEHHVKWQPAHRLAIYERALDWFDYWLRGIRSRSPQRQAELSHWDSLRAAPRSVTPR